MLLATHFGAECSFGPEQGEEGKRATGVEINHAVTASVFCSLASRFAQLSSPLWELEGSRGFYGLRLPRGENVTDVSTMIFSEEFE